MASARLVHEGAVLTGPHGRGSSTRRAPDCTILLEAWELHTDSACRVRSRENSSLLHLEPELYGTAGGLTNPNC